MILKLLPYVYGFSMIFFGAYLSLLGFKIINPKKDDPKQQERMQKWHKKFGGFSKYAGILIVVFGFISMVDLELNPLNFNSKTDNGGWTSYQKKEMIKGVIDNSKYLKSINPDTAQLVSKCYVDKYIEKYTLDEAWEQDKMSQKQMLELTMPIMNECFKEYGIYISN